MCGFVEHRRIVRQASELARGFTQHGSGIEVYRSSTASQLLDLRSQLTKERRRLCIVAFQSAEGLVKTLVLFGKGIREELLKTRFRNIAQSL